MKPFHWRCEPGNFGDDLNLWLWDALLPGFRQQHPEVLLVGVGTVLKRGLMPDDMKKLVVGSGVGYGPPPDLMRRRDWDVRCVRGPLTAEMLGLDPDLAVSDPAIMVSDLPEFRNLPKTTEVLFVPHWQSAVHGVWPAVAKAAQISYMSPCQDSKAVIRAIAQSKLVVAESMHGAIIADALRVPWIAVKTHHDLHNFKWQDWAASLGLTYQPQRILSSTRAEAGAKGERFWGFQREAAERAAEAVRESADEELRQDGQAGRRPSVPRAIAKHVLAAPAVLALRQACRADPQLSNDSVLADRKERLRAVLAGIRRDYLFPVGARDRLQQLAGLRPHLAQPRDFSMR
jgi:succinoglycan biosynthesis protein ExoV